MLPFQVLRARQHSSGASGPTEIVDQCETLADAQDKAAALVLTFMVVTHDHEQNVWNVVDDAGRRWRLWAGDSGSADPGPPNEDE